MYLLTAIFNINCLSDVLADLNENEIEGVTVSSVSGKGGLVMSKLDKNARIDIVVSSEKYKEIAKESIRSNTRDISNGSGKMWVTPVLEVERIRTGETNESALAHSVNKENKSLNDNYFTTQDTPAS